MSAFQTAFIGAGNMAGSILGGMLVNGFDAQHIAASAKTEASLTRLRGLNLRAVAADNREIAEGSDVVVLSVKPQIMRKVCEEIAPVLRENQLAVSVAAGIPADSLHRWLGGNIAVVRCMPNTPSLLGVGASGLFAHGAVSRAQRDQATSIMQAVGVVRWVEDEALLHAVTAVSGSGPAYFFQFMEAMIAEGQRMGLDAESARTLCAQTCMGAGRMLAEADVDAAELRRRVCSPGGTTERAVQSFAADDIEAVVGRAMRACYERSKEMGEELA
ncbi:MAG: pyrroline-5-carboxylate reductase [Congregibacter sp.]